MCNLYLHFNYLHHKGGELMAEKQITRKEFLKGMGTTLAGTAILGTGLLTGCAQETASSAEGIPAHPFKYKKLDPTKAAEYGYNAYFEKGGWGVGVAEGFFGYLAKEVGYPYDQIPTAAFTHAASGYGQGTLCGALGVAATCIGMVTDVDTSKKLVNELFNWYKTFEFPQYQPENLNLTHTIAESILCEDSVGKFMAAEGVAYGDHRRKARCAGVTADVLKKTIQLLNETLG